MRPLFLLRSVSCHMRRCGWLLSVLACCLACCLAIHQRCAVVMYIGMLLAHSMAVTTIIQPCAACAILCPVCHYLQSTCKSSRHLCRASNAIIRTPAAPFSCPSNPLSHGSFLLSHSSFLDHLPAVIQRNHMPVLPCHSIPCCCARLPPSACFGVFCCNCTRTIAQPERLTRIIRCASS